MRKVPHPRPKLTAHVLFSALAAVLAVLSVVSIGVSQSAQAAPSTTKKKATSTTKAKPLTGAQARKVATQKASVTLGSLRQSKLKLDQVRAKRAVISKNVSVAKLSSQQASQALASLTSRVHVTGVALDRAKRSQQAASRQASIARANVAALTARLEVLRKGEHDAALDAYTSGLAQSANNMGSAESVSDSARTNILGSMSRQRSADVLDELTAVQEDLRIQRSIADRAEKRATQYKASVSSTLTQYQQAKDQQSKVADTANSRLEEQLSEQETLSAVDKNLADEYARQTAELERQLRSAGIGAHGSGSYAGGTLPGSAGSGDVPTIGVGPIAGGGSATHNIVVAATLRPHLIALLADAQRGGIYFTGGGYRSLAAQISLRRSHCGSSNYSIYHAPASSCSPPTARPGFSQHERGLAIDFAVGGQGLTRGSRGYQWLRANAWRYGLKNLPSEAWHWSTTGR